MSYKTRKLRRRSQAFPGDDEQPVEAAEESQPSHTDNIEGSQVNGSEEGLTDEQRKELEVWDTFREENHEGDNVVSVLLGSRSQFVAVLEQLPLSLHRQLKLIRELDVQNEGALIQSWPLSSAHYLVKAFHTQLLSAVARYVEFRKHFMRQRMAAIDGQLQELVSPTNPPAESNGIPLVLGCRSTADPSGSRHVGALFQPEPGETTQGILQHIAQVSEESLRTTEEKVSIAQTAYETVDRHIRLLDQAIKEQEAAISLGMRPGTHLAPILLPDIIAVPRWARPSRVEHSPLALTPEPELPLPPIVPDEEVAVMPPFVKKGKKHVSHEPESKEEPAAALPTETPKTRRGVKLKIPPLPGPGGGPSIPPNLNEERYCYCNEVSYGTLTPPTHKMIACDNENCKLEWFHLVCTELSDLPSKKSKWYCRDCAPKMLHKGKPRS
ncbi:hypothetical protein J3A83DRAFT_4375959 [Scleroderma citrinum]